MAGTAAIRSLHRLRDECRCAKERLSRSTVTTLFADVPGYTGEVRLTRAELDGEIRAPLSVFVDVLREHLSRNRIHPAELVAVASIGGGANIPAVTTALSEQLRVPVITTPHPELTAAHGAALLAVRRPEDDSLTAVASPVQSATLRAIAWSEVDDGPDIAPLATDSDAPAGLSAARPRVDFVPAQAATGNRSAAGAWYRQILVTAGVFAAMVLVGTGAVLAIRNDALAMAGTMTTVRPEPASPAAAAPSELAVTPEDAAGAPSYIQAPAPNAPPPSTPTITPPQPTATSPPPSGSPSSPPSSEPPSPDPPTPPTQEDPPTQGDQPK